MLVWGLVCVLVWFRSWCTVGTPGVYPRPPSGSMEGPCWAPMVRCGPLTASCSSACFCFYLFFGAPLRMLHSFSSTTHFFSFVMFCQCTDDAPATTGCVLKLLAGPLLCTQDDRRTSSGLSHGHVCPPYHYGLMTKLKQCLIHL